MKNKKGFTLIELLAIIVILAIIAVITVPIILNIIENAKKGAATNSAYGYKDAIQKFYASKLTLDKNYNIPDGLHTKADFDTMGVKVNGKEPGENSFLRTANNMVTSGCLQFDEYKVEFIDGKPTNTLKGECKTVNVVYTDTNENTIIDLGDTVKIENEDFYVLEYPENGKVKLLPKYNLNSNSRQENGPTPTVDFSVYHAYDNDNDITFASANYWSEQLSNYPVDTYYPVNAYNTHYIYTRNTNNNLYNYIENYKNYLTGMGAFFVTDARLMTYSEARKTGCQDYEETNSYAHSCPTFIANQNYWLGTVRDSNGKLKTISKYIYKYGYLEHIGEATYDEVSGVRPLIEIYESAITDQYTIKFDSRGGGDVSDIKITTGSKIGTLPTNLVKEGATFEGWYTDKEYTTKISADTVPVGSATYYARYVLAKAEYTDSDSSGTINLGDSVKILDDYFYVVEAPFNGKVKLLAKYNLNANNRQENGRDPGNQGWATNIYNNTNNVAFSDSNYWESDLSSYSIDSNKLYDIYRNKNNEDTPNNLAGYINAYRTYLNRQGAEFVTDARLMTYAEALATGCTTSSCPSYIANQTYWLGTRSGSGTVKKVSYYIYNYGKKRELGSDDYTATTGVRPLIVIDESALTDNYTITFDSRGGTEVASRTITVGANVGTLPENPTKAGATFEGWYTDKEYNEKISADTVPIGSTTYYARYVLSKAEYTDSNESGTIDLGDKVKILDDYFYVIAAPADGKVKLLAEYNLNANSRQENGRAPSNAGWLNSIYNNDNNVPFSDENYWESNLTNYSKDANNLYYVYRTSDGEETANNLVGYIKAYQSYLNRLGAEYIIDARLMSYEEARATGCKVYDESGYSTSCPTYIANQTYWLGSRNNNNGSLKTVSYYIYNYGRKRHMGSNVYNEANTNGVRPLIIINESALTN